MMRSAQYPTSSGTRAFLGRSILSIRRNQVISMEPNEDQELEQLQLFQNQVAVRFLDLSTSSSDRLLSIFWLQKLLDAFLCCEEKFKAIVICKAKPPIDRLLADFLDRALKALDICNAVTHGVDALHRHHKQVKIAVAALTQTPLGEAQIRRAMRALNSLPATADAGDGYGTGERAWSFGRKGSSSRCGGGAIVADGGSAHSRSLSWTVSKAWSAAKQVQAMAANLAPLPRVAEIGGLGLPVYTMNMVLIFVMSALVVAVPCQDGGGLTMHFPVVARHVAWAAPMSRLHDGIVEEWKKKEKKGWIGVLEELQRLENCRQGLMEVVGDSAKFPIAEERAAEIRRIAADLAEICRSMEDGLGPLRCRVREVFHRIVRSRAEVLDCLDGS